MILKFSPFLFDSEYAWKQVINDPTYRYDMPISAFMLIYNRYRTESNNQTMKIVTSGADIFEQLEYSVSNTEPKKLKRQVQF